MTGTDPPPPARSFARLAGAAIGTMLGDALGMPVEGWPPERIRAVHGRVERLLPGRLPAGSYTDDSQMMIAILETLAHRGRLDPAYLAGRFLALHQPERGYGRRIAEVMRRIAQGRSWEQVGGDSWGNGGAMRVGVLGAVYPEDEATLLRAALDQCRVTHHHPQALAGAAALALGVGLACRLGARGENLRQDDFVAYLANRVEGVDHRLASRLRAMPALERGDQDQAREALVAAYARDVSAAEAVPAALGAFLASESAPQAVTLAVSLGGDADTIAAMAGSLAGARWRLEAWPQDWLAGLENGDQGRDHVLSLCHDIIEQKGVDESGSGC